MTIFALLQSKFKNLNFIQAILQYTQNFSIAEQSLLVEILTQFDFNEEQSQILLQAVEKQSHFHIQHEEHHDDNISICSHCINPPIPPLRDYYMWRNHLKR